MPASFKKQQSIIKRLALSLLVQIIGVVYYMAGLASTGLQRYILTTVGSGIVFIATAIAFLNLILFAQEMRKTEKATQKTIAEIERELK